MHGAYNLINRVTTSGMTAPMHHYRETFWHVTLKILPRVPCPKMGSPHNVPSPALRTIQGVNTRCPGLEGGVHTSLEGRSSAPRGEGGVRMNVGLGATQVGFQLCTWGHVATGNCSTSLHLELLTCKGVGTPAYRMAARPGRMCGGPSRMPGTQ